MHVYSNCSVSREGNDILLYTSQETNYSYPDGSCRYVGRVTDVHHVLVSFADIGKTNKLAVYPAWYNRFVGGVWEPLRPYKNRVPRDHVRRTTCNGCMTVCRAMGSYRIRI